MNWMLSLQCAWIGLHIFGLTAAWIVRVHAGMKSELLAQGLFLICFVAIAIAALAGLQCCAPMWTLSAATLSVMTVTAVADFGSEASS